jgi:phosphatidate cytidylyltransferase
LSARTRIVTAVPLIGGFLAALYWASPGVWTGITGLVLLLAAWEWGAMAGLGRLHGFLYSSLLCAASLGLAVARPDLLEPYYPALAFWLAAPILMARGVAIRSQTVQLLLGALVLIPTHLAMVALRGESPDLLLFVVGLVVIADSAAYFAGRKFGKHKLAPRISPGKTWEGAIGAGLAVTAYGLAVHFLDPAGCGVACLPQILAVLWSLFALSIVGDLFESTLKRQAGIKDSGNLLPGHGGVLDRIDSLTAVLPAATLFWTWLK